MAFTQTQYDELAAAIAAGALKVKYSGAGQSKEVEYRSLDDMMRILNLMGRDLGIISSTSGRKYASFRKGYYASPSQGCN